MKATRATKDGPWCWLSKQALKIIRESFDETNDVSSALAAYVALAELASNNGSEGFTTTRAAIASRAGMSVRKLSDILKTLETAKLLAITKNYIAGTDEKARAPSTYLLLASGNRCPTSGNNCTGLGTDRNQASLPSLKENREEGGEENGEEIASLGSRKTRPTPKHLPDPEWLAGLSKSAEYRGIDVQREHGKMARWCEVNRKQPTRRRFINWLNRIDQPMALAAGNRGQETGKGMGWRR